MAYPPTQRETLSQEPLFEKIELPEEEFLVSDRWGFGSCWDEVKDHFETVESLYEAVRDKLNSIWEIRENARPQIGTNQQLQALASEIFENGTYAIASDRMIPVEHGISGTYILTDSEGTPRFVVKPIDEEAGCLHNPKGLAAPFDSNPMRRYLPLYLSSFRDAAVWEIANAIGTGSVTPKTTLAVLQSDSFFDFSEQVAQHELARWIEQTGPASREKLCSIQEFIPDAQSLFTSLIELQRMDLSDEEIAKRFDSRDFEDANILLWTTYDLDGHSGNFLCYPKEFDSLGNEILGIKKIDNGMAFPDRNKEFRNHLKYLPNAHLPLSEEGREKILAIDVEALSATLEKKHLDSAIPALRKRIEELKQIASEPGITIKQINHKMGKIK